MTIASRDVEMNGVSIRKGDWLGLPTASRSPEVTSFDEVARPSSTGCSPGRATC